MDKKFITGIAILTIAIFVGGILFLSKVSTTSAPHRGTLGTSQQNSATTDTKLKPPDFTLPKYDGSGDVNLVGYMSPQKMKDEIAKIL